MYIDEQYLQTPFYGSRSMRNHIRRLGWTINRKPIQRLIRLKGLMEADFCVDALNEASTCICGPLKMAKA